MQTPNDLTASNDLTAPNDAPAQRATLALLPQPPRPELTCTATLFELTTHAVTGTLAGPDRSRDGAAGP